MARARAAVRAATAQWRVTPDAQRRKRACGGSQHHRTACGPPLCVRESLASRTRARRLRQERRARTAAWTGSARGALFVTTVSDVKMNPTALRNEGGFCRRLSHTTHDEAVQRLDFSRLNTTLLQTSACLVTAKASPGRARHAGSTARAAGAQLQEGFNACSRPKAPLSAVVRPSVHPPAPDKGLSEHPLVCSRFDDGRREKLDLTTWGGWSSGADASTPDTYLIRQPARPKSDTYWIWEHPNLEAVAKRGDPHPSTQHTARPTTAAPGRARPSHTCASSTRTSTASKGLKHLRLLCASNRHHDKPP